MPQGTIKKLVADKGFGFISGERGELFFHHSSLEGTAIEAHARGTGGDLRGGTGTERPAHREGQAGVSGRLLPLYDAVGSGSLCIGTSYASFRTRARGVRRRLFRRWGWSTSPPRWAPTPRRSSWSTSGTSARPARSRSSGRRRTWSATRSTGRINRADPRDINALPPGIMTILGGRTATENPRYWLEACPNADAVVCGDGEQAIAEIAAGRPWTQIAGLVCRGDDGQLVFNPPRPNAPLDDGLMPARELRRRPYYLHQQGREHGHQARSDRRVARLSVQLQVLQFLAQSLGRETPLDGQVAGVDRPRDRTNRRRPDHVRRRRVHPPAGAGRRDLRLADRQGIRKNYIANARLEIADRPDILRKMEQAGFVALLIGVESTQDATLKSMGKGFTIGRVRQRFKCSASRRWSSTPISSWATSAKPRSRWSPPRRSPARSAWT